jgi:hypothetical protein
LPTFIAHVEFRCQAESLKDGGKQLVKLTKAAGGVGFEMIRGRIEPMPPGMDTDEGSWTGYGPKID